MDFPKITFSYPVKPGHTAAKPRIGEAVPMLAQSDDALEWILAHRYTAPPHVPIDWLVPDDAAIDAAAIEWVRRYPVPQWEIGRKGWGQVVDAWVQDQGTSGLIDLICVIARMEANGESPRNLPWVCPAVAAALAARDNGIAATLAAQWLAWLADRHDMEQTNTPAQSAKAAAQIVWDAAGGNRDRYAGAPERPEWAAADCAYAAEVRAQRDALLAVLSPAA